MYLAMCILSECFRDIFYVFSYRYIIMKCIKIKRRIKLVQLKKYGIQQFPTPANIAYAYNLGDARGISRRGRHASNINS